MTDIQTNILKYTVALLLKTQKKLSHPTKYFLIYIEKLHSKQIKIKK